MQNRRSGLDDQPTSSSETILVTGATGFVGSNIVLHLAKHGHCIIAFDLVQPPSIVERFWRDVRGGIVFETGSVFDAKRLAKIGRQHKPTMLVSAAAVTAVDVEAERQMATRITEVNLVGTVRVLDLARHLRVRRVLYISSAGVYGNSAPLAKLTEDARLQVKGLYMIAKEASERICRRYGELFNLDVIVGRLGQPFGPMERDTGVRSVMSPIYQMARLALRGETVRVSPPDYSCDWTYTLDLAEAVRLVLESQALRYRVYNLSSGQASKMSDAIALLKSSFPGTCFKWVGDDEEANIDTRSDPRRGPLDISRLRNDVGYEPVYTLESGLRDALPWWRAMTDVEAPLPSEKVS